MSVINKDILVEISNDQLPKLASLYEQNAKWAPYVTALVHTGIKLKQSSKFKDLIKFFSPNNSWEKDGTIIVTILFSVMDVLVFSLEDNCNNLYQGLSKTQVVDFSKVSLFYGVHEKQVPTIRRFIKEQNLGSFNEIPVFIYTISPEQASNFNIVVPPEVYVKKLEPSAIKRVNELWPHKFPGSENYLVKYIETNGGYGVFLKSSNEMIAWVLKHVQGNMTMLQTEDKFKRNGYASLVIKVLAKEIGEEGHWPMSTTLLNNKGSINMYEKLGFRSIGQAVFFAREEN